MFTFIATFLLQTLASLERIIRPSDTVVPEKADGEESCSLESLLQKVSLYEYNKFREQSALPYSHTIV